MNEMKVKCVIKMNEMKNVNVKSQDERVHVSGVGGTTTAYCAARLFFNLYEPYNTARNTQMPMHTVREMNAVPAER